MKSGLLMILSCMLAAALSAGCAASAPQPEEENLNSVPQEEEETWDRIPMVQVNGTLYLDTGYESSVDARCGVMDGEITSEVAGSEIPTVDDQSNFGTGYGYQYGFTEGTIELYLNGGWRIFATEEVRQELQFPRENEVVQEDDIPPQEEDADPNAGTSGDAPEAAEGSTEDALCGLPRAPGY